MVRQRRRLLLGALASAALLPAAGAAAQLPTGAPGLYAPDYGTLITQATALRQALGQNVGAAPDRTAPRKPARGRPARRGRADQAGRRTPRTPERKPPTARQRATLRFAGDPAVTAAVDRTFADGFGAPGVEAELVLADLARLREAAIADLRAMGWSPTHLGDVAAYALIGGYLRLHEQTTVPRKVAVALRRVVHDALAAQPSVRRLPDARQQELAETLLLRIAYSAAHLNTLTDQGDAAGAERVREQLRSFIEAIYGVDPARARLGARGLVPRRG